MNPLARAVAKLRRDGLAATVAAAARAVRYSFDFKRQIAYRRMLRQEGLKARFSAIYDHNLWSSAESGSGLGSEVQFTRNLREWLARSIPALGIRTFVDAPCGDFNWMRLVTAEQEFDYLGLDIVESVIAANTRRYQGARTRFAVANICEDPIPACDLLMVRDCLFHLSYADVERVLGNLARTEYKYLLTTSHTTGRDFRNSDITSGDFRLIDLFKPPFCFDASRVIDAVDDFPEGFPAPRQMILVAKNDVPTRLADQS